MLLKNVTVGKALWDMSHIEDKLNTKIFSLDFDTFTLNDNRINKVTRVFINDNEFQNYNTLRYIYNNDSIYQNDEKISDSFYFTSDKTDYLIELNYQNKTVEVFEKPVNQIYYNHSEYDKFLLAFEIQLRSEICKYEIFKELKG